MFRESYAAFQNNWVYEGEEDTSNSSKIPMNIGIRFDKGVKSQKQYFGPENVLSYAKHISIFIWERESFPKQKTFSCSRMLINVLFKPRRCNTGTNELWDCGFTIVNKTNFDKTTQVVLYTSSLCGDIIIQKYCLCLYLIDDTNS